MNRVQDSDVISMDNLIFVVRRTERRNHLPIEPGGPLKEFKRKKSKVY